MGDFAIIVPDRGDRKQFYDHCLSQINRFTVKPKKLYLMNEKPLNNKFDLVFRIKQGVELAKRDGFEWVLIVENDDYYPDNYCERFLPFFDKHDFIGQEHSTYYNLRNRTYNRFDHHYRASLFTTAFRISSMNLFDWPDPDSPFLDIPLWQYARHKRRKFIETGAIGIKHAIGLCGGKGHKFVMRSKDPNLQWLKGQVDAQSFGFYKEMADKLQMQPA